TRSMAQPVLVCRSPSPMTTTALSVWWSPRRFWRSFQASPARRMALRTRSRSAMFSPSEFMIIPFDDWVNVLVRDWIVPNFRPLFRALQVPVSMVLAWLDTLFNAVPMLVFTALLALAAWRTAGRGMAIFAVASLFFIDMIGLWP